MVVLTADSRRLAAERERLVRVLRDLDARRDWGHARDYVLGMWQILQQNQPDDYVLATGTSKSVREFVELAFQEAPLPTSGACSAEWRERRKVLVYLRLREETGDGGVVLDGRAEIRYIIDDDDDMDDDNVYGYLELYAPF